MKTRTLVIWLLLFLGGCRQSETDVVDNPSNRFVATETKTITVGDICFDMVEVKAGSYIMGCTSEQYGECFGNESPCHKVTITQDYYIGKYEVTQELYEAVMDTNPSCWKELDRPVENVRWIDAVEFCAKLSRMTGRDFCLPTEAEWEYAARGGRYGVGSKFSGSVCLSEVAWYTGNSEGQTHPVGLLLPNELGVYDMSGNVWEWCQDYYANYNPMDQTNPLGPESGGYRVLRGGCWASSARNCRHTMRSMNAPDYRYRVFGFRVVLH